MPGADEQALPSERETGPRFTSLRLQKDNLLPALSNQVLKANACLAGLDAFKVMAARLTKPENRLAETDSFSDSLRKGALLMKDYTTFSQIRACILLITRIEEGFKGEVKDKQGLVDAVTRLLPPKWRGSPLWSPLEHNFNEALSLTEGMTPAQLDFWAKEFINRAGRDIEGLAAPYLDSKGENFPGHREIFKVIDESQPGVVLDTIEDKVHRLGHQFGGHIVPTLSMIVGQLVGPETSARLLPTVRKIFNESFPDFVEGLQLTDRDLKAKLTASYLKSENMEDKSEKGTGGSMTAGGLRERVAYISGRLKGVSSPGSKGAIDLKLTVDPDTEKTLVNCPIEVFSETLMALIENGNRFNDTQVLITLSLSRDRDGQTIGVIGLITNGQPFPPEIINAGRFKRGNSHESDGSTKPGQYGIGLAVAQEKIEASGGKLAMINYPNKNPRAPFPANAALFLTFPIGQPETVTVFNIPQKQAVAA